MRRSIPAAAAPFLLASALAAAAPGGVKDLESAVPSVRAAAALSCARAGAVDAVPAVAAAFLREPDEAARRAEARSLVSLETPSALPALFLHPEVLDSRLALLDPLAQAPGAEPYLISGLGDAHAAVRSFCLRHLRFPEDPVRVERAVLDRAADEGDAATLREALATAGWVGGRTALEFLLGLLPADPWTAAVAARSLAQIAAATEIPEAFFGPVAQRLSAAVVSGAPGAVKAEILSLAAGDPRLAPLVAPAAGSLLLRSAPSARADAGLLAAASWLLLRVGYRGHEGRIRAGALLLDPDGLADGAGMLLSVDGAAAAAPMVRLLEDPRCFRAALDGLVRLGEAARPAFAAGIRSAAWNTAYALWQVRTATRAMTETARP